MVLFRSFWDRLIALWAGKSAIQRAAIVIGILILSPFLFISALVGLIYEVVAAVDRNHRLTGNAHWAVSVFAVIGVLLVFSAVSPRSAKVTDVAAAAESSSPTILTPSPTSTPAATAVAVASLSPAPASAAAATALGVDSPLDGAAVTQSALTVSGTAPAGVRVVQDISLASDKETTADANGWWSIPVELKGGANDLVFRIGDDKSTTLHVNVTYTPAAEAVSPQTVTPKPATPGPSTLNSATPKPTPKPAPTPDVMRSPEFVAMALKSQYDITFEDSPLLDGTVRKLGRDSTGLVIVELTDDPINSMSVVGPIPGSGTGTEATIGSVMGAESAAFGDPAGMTDWLLAQMKASWSNSDREVSKRFGKVVAHLQWYAATLGMMTITLDHD